MEIQNEMTLRTISKTLEISLDALAKQYRREFGESHQGFDAVLQAQAATALLQRMSEPTTRRTPQAANAAAQLLAEFNACKHQNGHLDEEPEMKAARSHDSQILRDFAALSEKPARRLAAPAKRVNPAPVQVQEVVPVVQPKKRRWPVVTMLDVVYYTTIATAVYGLWFTLKEMGLAFAVPYALVSFHALSMAKNPESRQTAKAGLGAVVVLEILTFFIHLVLFNLRAVQAAKADTLPFSYWETTEMPFYIACILAGLFSAAGVYAVAVTFSLTSEKHSAGEKEKADADALRLRVAELEKALKRSADGWSMVDGWNEVRRTVADMYAQEANETLH
jgi:hypothetical protein